MRVAVCRELGSLVGECSCRLLLSLSKELAATIPRHAQSGALERVTGDGAHTDQYNRVAGGFTDRAIGPDELGFPSREQNHFSARHLGMPPVARRIGSHQYAHVAEC